MTTSPLNMPHYLEPRKIKAIIGPSTGFDMFGTKYTTLIQGMPKDEGEPLRVLYLVPSDELVRQFHNELDLWLAGRNLIVWRTEPQLITEDSPFFRDRRTREEIEDGLAEKWVPVQASYIYCRLTAYTDINSKYLGVTA